MALTSSEPLIDPQQNKADGDSLASARHEIEQLIQEIQLSDLPLNVKSSLVGDLSSALSVSSPSIRNLRAAIASAHRNYSIASIMYEIIESGTLAQSFDAETIARYEQLSLATKNRVDRVFQLLAAETIDHNDRIDFIIKTFSTPGQPEMSREMAESLAQNPDTLRLLDLMRENPTIGARVVVEINADAEDQQHAIDAAPEPERGPMRADASMGIRPEGRAGQPRNLDQFMTQARPIMASVLQRMPEEVKHQISSPEAAIALARQVFADTERHRRAVGDQTSADGAAVRYVSELSAEVAARVAARRFLELRAQGRGFEMTQAELVSEVRRTNPALFPAGSDNAESDAALNRIAGATIEAFHRPDVQQRIQRDGVRAIPSVSGNISSAAIAQAAQALNAQGQSVRDTSQQRSQAEIDRAARERDALRDAGTSTFELEFVDAANSSTQVRTAMSAVVGSNSQDLMVQFAAVGILNESTFGYRVARNGGLDSLGHREAFNMWNDESMGRLNTNTNNDLRGAQLGLEETLNAIRLLQFMRSSEANRGLVDNNTDRNDMLDAASMQNAMKIVALVDEGADGLNTQREINNAARLMRLVNTNGGGVSDTEVEQARRLNTLLRDGSQLLATGANALNASGVRFNAAQDLDHNGQISPEELARVLAMRGVGSVQAIDTQAELRTALGLPAQQPATPTRSAGQ